MNERRSAENDPLAGIVELSLPHDDATVVLELLARAWDEGSHATAYSGVTYTDNPYRPTPPAMSDGGAA